MPGSTGAAVARAQGELALRALGQAYAQPACEAVLHPRRDRVLAADPALPKARQAAAVRSVLEPMILGDMDDLAIGHGRARPMAAWRWPGRRANRCGAPGRCWANMGCAYAR